MDEKESRYHEIDILVEDSGHSYNPLTERFEATSGSDAENNLDHDSDSIRAALGRKVSDEDWKGYLRWKRRKADDNFYQQQADELMEAHEQEQKE